MHLQFPAREISRFGSSGVDMDFLPQVLDAERTTVHIARIVAGGRLGEHPAVVPQIFAVLAGDGLVTSKGVAGDADERWPGAQGAVREVAGLILIQLFRCVYATFEVVAAITVPSYPQGDNSPRRALEAHLIWRCCEMRSYGKGVTPAMWLGQ